MTDVHVTIGSNSDTLQVNCVPLELGAGFVLTQGDSTRDHGDLASGTINAELVERLSRLAQERANLDVSDLLPEIVVAHTEYNRMVRSIPEYRGSRTKMSVILCQENSIVAILVGKMYGCMYSTQYIPGGVFGWRQIEVIEGPNGYMGDVKMPELGVFEQKFAGNKKFMLSDSPFLLTETTLSYESTAQQVMDAWIEESKTDWNSIPQFCVQLTGVEENEDTEWIDE